MTAILFSLVLLLGEVTVNEACSCLREHPQEQFCGADFVIRAEVLSQEVTGHSLHGSRVFNLRILKTFKGELRLNQTEGIHVNGSGKGSLFVKAYTAMVGEACGVWLTDGTVYVLGGNIWEEKLRLSSCNFIGEWSKVTPRQRAGIRRFYGQNCECRISPCYGDGCKKLEGCAVKSVRKLWKWRHFYCLKNADGTACSWCKAAKYKKCKSKARNN